MSLPRLAVQRPVLSSVVLIILFLVGAVSLTGVELDLLPELNLPVAAVITSYPGAGPAEVESLVTRPLESAMATVGEVDHVTSTSREGLSLVIINFNWGVDLDNATLEMRDALDMVAALLPGDADTPRVMKFDPGMMPIMTVSVSGPDDLAQAQRVATDILVPRLERLQGVASVQVEGGWQREIRILFDPVTLAHHRISMDQVGQILRASNLNLPAGSLDEGSRSFTVRSIGEFQSLEEIRSVRIPVEHGSLALSDIAEVLDTTKDSNQLTRLNGAPSLALSVQKESGANTVSVSRAVQRELEQVERLLPPGYQTAVVLDQGDFIVQSIMGVVQNGLLGGLLAIIVLFVFLRDWRSTLVTALAIPFSTIVSFAWIYFSGLTMNLLSMGGLALGIGMMVDNAIVVLENIYSKLQEGLSPAQAAIEGTQEVGAAITASTLTTLSVFLPVVFLQGIAVEIFRDLSLTVSFALVTSLMVALVGVPLLATRLLRRQTGEARDRGAGRLAEGYRGFLHWTLRHRAWMVAILILVVLGGVALVPFMQMEFLPEVDDGQVVVSVRMPAGSTLDEMDRYMARLETKAMEMDGVISVLTYVGTSSRNVMGGGLGGGGRSATGELQVVMVDRGDRDETLWEAADALRDIAQGIPGGQATVSAGFMSTMSGGSEGSGAMGGLGGPPVVVEFRGEDLKQLERLTQETEDRLRKVAGTRDYRTTFDEALPELRLVADRDRIMRHGLTPAQVAQTVRTAMVGETVTRYRTGGTEVDVTVRLSPETLHDRDTLGSLPIITPSGTVVPLLELVTIEEGSGPTAIRRTDQARTGQVSAYVSNRSSSAVLQDVEEQLSSLSLPPGYTMEIGGEQELMSDAFSTLALAAVMGFVLMYLIMAAQFESFLFPVAVVLTVPMSLAGVVYGLVLSGRTFNAAAFVGVIMVMGIIVNNAIVMVDYINQLRRRGQEREEAVLNAGSLRLRPILMTALTTLLAMVPLSLGLGEGAELQAPLATAVIAGLFLGTLLTLLVLPVLYTILDERFGAELERIEHEQR